MPAGPRPARNRCPSFTARYGDAPDMTEGAGDVFVVFDPAEALDAMHAALFARPHVTALRARRIGPQVEQALEGMQFLTPLIAAACEGGLDAPLFHRLFRTRRSYGPYADRLMDLLGEDRALPPCDPGRKERAVARDRAANDRA
jgi:hypothetical protein